MNANNSDAYNSIADLLIYGDIPDDEALRRAKALLRMHPNVVEETDDRGLTLLHAAAGSRGSEFCKLLVKMKPDLVRTADIDGELPVHTACSFNSNGETTKYLLCSYPESINIPDSEGYCPLHYFFRNLTSDRAGANISEQDLDVLRLLLHNDQGAVSKPTNISGDLPLHLACMGFGSILAKSVYNSYPEAILVQNNDRDTPLDIARRWNQPELVSCLEIQLGYVLQAREGRRNGQLSIHQALRSANILAGTLKLMVAANPSSVTTADNQGNIPLHIACQMGNLDAVTLLIRIDDDSLKTRDLSGNLPLHLACKHGRCEIIPCILEQSAFGVTVQNSEKQTPIELLFYEAECDRDSMVYAEAIRCLFQVNPVDILKCLVKSKSADADKD
eukprot:scaffold52590_cov23-Cyclotella_meneghiniana.AAC.4